MKRVRLGDVANVEISGIDKKTKENEKSVRLCNFVDVYYNWAITKNMYDGLMLASASDSDIETFILRKGQVAITKDSETRDDIGVAAYIADDFDDVVLGYHCALITPKNDIPEEDRIYGKYLNAILHTKYAQKHFSNNATGSGQRYTLSKEAVEDMIVYLPSPKEQECIGNYLSDIDHKIELNNLINDKLEALAKQIYDYWFVQFDFPNEDGKPYKSSGGKMVWNETLKREIPENWVTKSLNDLSISTRGVTYSPSDLVEKNYGVLVLRGNNIENNHIVYDSNVAYIPHEMISENQYIRKYDIIMTMSSGSKTHLGKCAIFFNDSPHTYGAFLSKFTPNKECPLFFFGCATTSFFRKKVQSVNGTGINNLSNTIIDSILFPYPHRTLIIKEYENKVANIYNIIGTNIEQNEILTSHRNFLLPLLVNGQITIKD